VSHLVEALASLPDTALVPVGWVRALLDTPAPVPVDTPELSVSAFGRLVSRSGATVRSWCERGLIPGAYKLPGDRRRAAWRIPSASVAAFRQRNASNTSTTPTPEPVAAAPERDLGAWRRVGRRRSRRR